MVTEGVAQPRKAALHMVVCRHVGVQVEDDLEKRNAVIGPEVLHLTFGRAPQQGMSEAAERQRQIGPPLDQQGLQARNQIAVANVQQLDLAAVCAECLGQLVRRRSQPAAQPR
jgi:hypothetical protein